MNLIRHGVIASLASALFCPFLCRGAETSESSVARNWTDSTGRFHTVAMLIGGDHSQVRLRKQQSGSIITVPIARLSDADQQFVSNRFEAEGSERKLSASSSQTDPKALRLGRGELLNKAAAWLNEIKASSPAATKAASVGNAVASDDSTLLSKNALQLPENMIYVRVSAAFLRRWVEKDLSHSGRVNDNILGTPIVGDSTTVCRTQLELQPNRQAAVGVLRLFGTTNSTTIGDGGPVKIFTDSATQFQSAKTIWLDWEGIHLTPAVTNAQTHSTITGLQTSLPRLRGRIALRIAGNRVAERHAMSEAVTAQHVSQRVSRRFDESASEEMAALWEAMSAQLASLDAGNPLRPREWHASSTKDMFQLVALGGPGDGSGYVPAPATDLGSADVQVDIHIAVIKRAIGDTKLKNAIQPAVALLTAMPRSEPADRPVIDWSLDRNWLSIAWGSTGNRQEPVDRTAATGKAAR